jgi:hypothetical protein
MVSSLLCRDRERLRGQCLQAEVVGTSGDVSGDRSVTRFSPVATNPNCPCPQQVAAATGRSVDDARPPVSCWLDHNVAVEMMPVDWTTAPRVVANEPNFVSINAATEVDLMGQAASETIAGCYWSSSGGQATEYGIAALGGASLDQRARRRLIGFERNFDSGAPGAWAWADLQLAGTRGVGLVGRPMAVSTDDTGWWEGRFWESQMAIRGVETWSHPRKRPKLPLVQQQKPAGRPPPIGAMRGTQWS